MGLMFFLLFHVRRAEREFLSGVLYRRYDAQFEFRPPFAFVRIMMLFRRVFVLSLFSLSFSRLLFLRFLLLVLNGLFTV